MLKAGIRGVAYETIELPDGQLPCLQTMSEIAGRLAVQEGAKYLEKTFGGRGLSLGGVPGVERGKVGIIGDRERTGQHIMFVGLQALVVKDC